MNKNIVFALMMGLLVMSLSISCQNSLPQQNSQEGVPAVLFHITPPPPGNDGCTPGFWKNHLDAWGPTGFSPSDDFDTVFFNEVGLFNPDITLDDAINARGGGVKKLARHGTAALLSAAHPDVDYPLDVAGVISAVRAGDADTLADFNELNCPLSN